ncbi:hypothetical protein JW898_06085 [Candidatus Woesearchaeota archaeon]|nr:hypothetical protein [Candidatus Woesearchaeota archaeon]
MALAVVAFSQTAFAQEAEPSNETGKALAKNYINMYIAYGKVLVESEMLFTSKETINFSVSLPYDARDITNSIDKFEYPAILESNNLMFFLKNSRYVKYSYITDELLEGDSFIAAINAPFNTEELRIKVSLPEKAVLDRPMGNSQVSGSAVYPQPKRLETDGQVITVVWVFNDVKKDDDIALYIKYRKPASYWIPPILMVLGVLVVLAAVLYLAYRSNGKRKARARIEVREVRGPKAPESEDIDRHLKEDEQQIINVIRLKEGCCEQGTLRIATGFSKAKLSGLLKEMEVRKIIHKEKRGKKNLVFLKG